MRKKMKRVKFLTVAGVISMMSISALTRFDSNAGAFECRDLVEGGQIYAASCATCHDSGVAGSPRLGNADDWTPLLAKGGAVLRSHAMRGFNAMPPKGGRLDLSDCDFESAVGYMISKAE
ncbi:putative Cytochrome c-555 [Candidatus Desulfarcum epimagneticum]|uniref:Putative Cytochrome c-555 n=1 Tax=uncultured Desulfobacteraceae bacterium TaxID=218296 RepID=A0A484HDF0_9BACT|nr:putative Cytochrome c-555 [uncultured Desulfobacteraceae bacterium]